MTLTQLNYILAVAQHRHFAAAAEACHVTQPTLSMQIQKLEEDLGVILFDRSRQPVRPTEIGEKILAQARIAVRESQKVIELAQAQTNEVNGELSLGVIPTLAPYLLPLFAARFVEQYPNVELVVEELQTQQIVERIKNNTLDVGLLVTPLHNPTIAERVLFNEPFLVYLSENHPLAKQKKIKEGDLSNQDVWLLNEGHCFRDQVISLCHDRGRRSPAALNLRFESGNLETLRKMVDQSTGYTLLPYLAALELSQTAHRGHVREFTAPIPTREVSLVHASSYTRTAAIEALCKVIQDAIPKEMQKLRQGSFHRVDMPPFK